jgi:hypothetical protein
MISSHSPSPPLHLPSLLLSSSPSLSQGVGTSISDVDPVWLGSNKLSAMNELVEAKTQHVTLGVAFAHAVFKSAGQMLILHRAYISYILFSIK